MADDLRVGSDLVQKKRWLKHGLFRSVLLSCRKQEKTPGASAPEPNCWSNSWSNRRRSSWNERGVTVCLVLTHEAMEHFMKTNACLFKSSLIKARHARHWMKETILCISVLLPSNYCNLLFQSAAGRWCGSCRSTGVLMKITWEMSRNILHQKRCDAICTISVQQHICKKTVVTPTKMLED